MWLKWVGLCGQPTFWFLALVMTRSVTGKPTTKDFAVQRREVQSTMELATIPLAFWSLIATMLFGLLVAPDCMAVRVGEPPGRFWISTVLLLSTVLWRCLFPDENYCLPVLLFSTIAATLRSRLTFHEWLALLSLAILHTAMVFWATTTWTSHGIPPVLLFSAIVAFGIWVSFTSRIEPGSSRLDGLQVFMTISAGLCILLSDGSIFHNAPDDGTFAFTEYCIARLFMVVGNRMMPRRNRTDTAPI